MQIMFRSRLRPLANDTRANVAIVFALATLPMLGAVGASIDYTYANMKRTRFQAAIDSTALMLAKEAAGDSASELQSNAKKYFNALYQNADNGDIQITAAYDAVAGKKVVVSGQTSVPTMIMKIMGFKLRPRRRTC
jgi:Flp pilus assembly protein TadG